MLVYPGGQIPDNIPAGSPPTFLLVANDDDYGCDKVTLAIYEKLRGRLSRPSSSKAATPSTWATAQNSSP